MDNLLPLVGSALWRTLAVALLLGAGIPALFSVGIRAMAWGAGDTAVEGPARPGNPAGRPLAFLCFAIVLIAVALGITFIVASGFGKALSFEHIVPTLVDK